MNTKVTNTSIFDHEYLMALFGGETFPDGSYMVDELEGIMEFQKMFLEEMSEIRAHNMFTFPVNSISLIKKNGKFVDEEFAKWACEHNRKWNDSNFFVDETVTSLSNCCRLKSNIKDLGYFNSIGSTALRVGSVKVSTINLARIAYESDSEEEYLEKLKYTMNVNLKLLHIVRSIIKRNIEKLSHFYKLLYLGIGGSVLPLIDSLPRYSDSLCEIILGESVIFSENYEFFLESHYFSPFPPLG